MKSKLYTLALLVFVIGLSACHYGVEDVQEGLDRNEEYKGKRAEREAATALPEDAAAKMRGEVSEESAETMSADTSSADTTSAK